MFWALDFFLKFNSIAQRDDNSLLLRGRSNNTADTYGVDDMGVRTDGPKSGHVPGPGIWHLWNFRLYLANLDYDLGMCEKVFCTVKNMVCPHQKWFLVKMVLGENVTKYHILCGVLNQIIASHFFLLFYSNFLFWRVRDNYNFKWISVVSKSNNFSLFLNFPW